MSPRGTSWTPGADPTRLPIGLDLRAISIAEGVRAGLAAALPMAASVWLGQPLLSLAALGALLTCIVDPGGPLRRRLPIQLVFIVAGAVLLGGFGLLRSAGIAATVVAAFPVLFATGFLRVWGAPAMALGNMLAVVLLLGTDNPLTLWQAMAVAGVFAGGAAWALLLTLALWQIHPFGPARRAVADVWDAEAQLVRMLQSLVEQSGGEQSPHPHAGWDVQARAGRGGVRSAIERARTVLMDTANTRGPDSGPGVQNLLRLEAADQLFAALIGLSDLLEDTGAADRAAALAMLRRLRPLLHVLALATERERMPKPTRFARAIALLDRDAKACPVLAPAAHAIAERLRVATRLIDPALYLPGSGTQGDAGIPWSKRMTAPAAANWTMSSASLRHAIRLALVATAALAATLVHHSPYTHWLTITLVLVMQPFFATTWQRTLERVGGTLLGGAVAATLSALLHTRLHLAGALPVLSALALAVRQVSYAVYIAVYTPVIILLVEQILPQADQMDVALARAGYTVLGGLIAVAANALLWPAWQPAQVAEDLTTAITAHADYARRVLLDGGDPGHERRHAGLASNNLEASLQRAMHEPLRSGRDRLQSALVADATLRRIAGRLAALSLAPAPLIDVQETCATRQWVPDTLAALASGVAPAPRPRSGDGSEVVDRLARQVELLAFSIGGAVDSKTISAEVKPQ